MRLLSLSFAILIRFSFEVDKKLSGGCILLRFMFLFTADIELS